MSEHRKKNTKVIIGKILVVSIIGLVLYLIPWGGKHIVYKDPAEDAILLNEHENHDSMYNMDQGAYQLPLQVLLSLNAPDGKTPLIDTMKNYGMISRDPTPNNTSALPIGMTTVDIGGVIYTSMNCAVCHTGKIRVNGQAYIIDGIPNQFKTMAWAKHVEKSIQTTITNPVEFLQFVKRLISKNHIKVKELKNTTHEDIDNALQLVTECSNQLGHPISNKSNTLPKFPSISNNKNVSEADEKSFREHTHARIQSRYIKSLIITEHNSNKGETNHSELYQSEIKKEIKYIKENYKISDKLKEEVFPAHMEHFQPLSPTLKRSNSAKIDPQEESMKKVGKTFADLIHVLKHQLKYGNNILSIVNKMGHFGPGRDDAWTILSDLVVNDGNLTSGPIPTYDLDQAPVKVPSLFPYASYTNSENYQHGAYYFHCDGNTNTMIQRNLLQAMAIGAPNSKVGSDDKNETMVQIDKLIEAEKYYTDVKTPQFAEAFPDHFDAELAKKGEELFKKTTYDIVDADGSIKQETCYSCHYSKQEGREIPIEWVETNRRRWAFYHAEEKNNEYLQLLGQRAREYTHASATDQGFSLDNYYLQNDTWYKKRRLGYFARPLHGIWASAPYLHNASVRTIRELLTKPEDRESSFFSGSRNYNIDDLGYESEEYYFPDNIQTEKNKVKAFLRQVGTVENATHLKNKTKENIGHDFGSSWSNEEKDAVIEYIKSL